MGNTSLNLSIDAGELFILLFLSSSMAPKLIPVSLLPSFIIPYPLIKYKDISVPQISTQYGQIQAENAIQLLEMQL
jgi:hypothetical protein